MLDLAIVGAGSMGANHARVAMGLRDARVSLIVDPDDERGKSLAATCGADYAAELSEVPGRVGAAVLAAPTDMHRALGVELLAAGVHLLVEKPIADTPDDARALIDAAAGSGVTLMVGHVERFNPAIIEIERIVNEPVHVETQRVSPYTPRIGDGVVLDLMIHDLDIARSIIHHAVVGIEAFTTHLVSETEDLAVALLRFENGATATLTASRLGQQKVRRMIITEADRQIAVDLMRRDLTIHRVGEVSQEPGQGSYRQSAIVETPFLPALREPLYLELEHFVASVIGGTKPKVSGEDGLEALRLAFDVISAASTGELSS